jgi:putative membrane protein
VLALGETEVFDARPVGAATVNHHIPSRSLAALVAVAGLAAATLAVSAQPQPGGPPPAPGMDRPGPRMPAGEGDFVRQLDAANTAELDTAKYVVNRTKSAEVHQFAQHMIDDHSTAAVALEAATRGTNLRPAPREGETSGQGRRGLAMLMGETGTKLDDDYMRIQVPAHRRALALLQWETQNGQNMGLKDLAAKLTPTVAQHLQLAQAYLAAHNLTPFAPPDAQPVPGNPNPNNRGAGQGPGTPNNPASSTNGGSTSGQNNGTGGTAGNPVGAPTYSPLGSGTPPANANGGASTPAPAPSSSPHP